jgi:hypothetical protein
MGRPQKRILPDRTGTLIVGLILTAIGGGLLIERIWHVSVWYYIGQLWPVLLIIVGVTKLIDYFRWRRLQQEDRFHEGA